jgi:uncharacterized protein YbaR (Trm112 family)
MLSNELLNILVCPVCKGILQTDSSSQQLICMPCNLKFQVKDGIPVMLVDEAAKIGESEPGTRD